jgi:hypothetical protein
VILAGDPLLSVAKDHSLNLVQHVQEPQHPLLVFLPPDQLGHGDFFLLDIPEDPLLAA